MITSFEKVPTHTHEELYSIINKITKNLKSKCENLDNVAGQLDLIDEGVNELMNYIEYLLDRLEQSESDRFSL